MRAALHDLGNLLTVINGFAELAERKARTGNLAGVIADLSKVRQVSADGCEIIRAAFAGDVSALKGDFFDLNNVVRKLAGQIDAQLHARGIELRMQLSDGPIVIAGDEMSMQRALFNLCLNARNAIARSGSIIIATEEGAETAALTVSDTGSGMSGEMMCGLWQRQPRGAHGHGLQVVRSVIEDFSGKIDVRSEVGKGTTFRIVLPLAQRVSEMPGTKAA